MAFPFPRRYGPEVERPGEDTIRATLVSGLLLVTGVSACVAPSYQLSVGDSRRYIDRSNPNALSCEDIAELYSLNLIELGEAFDEQIYSDPRSPTASGAVVVGALRYAIVGGFVAALASQYGHERKGERVAVIEEEGHNLEAHALEKNCAPMAPPMDRVIAANTARYQREVDRWEEARVRREKMDATFRDRPDLE